MEKLKWYMFPEVPFNMVQCKEKGEETDDFFFVKLRASDVDVRIVVCKIYREYIEEGNRWWIYVFDKYGNVYNEFDDEKPYAWMAITEESCNFFGFNSIKENLL